jgi:hypothetical protein
MGTCFLEICDFLIAVTAMNWNKTESVEGIYCIYLFSKTVHCNKGNICWFSYQYFCGLLYFLPHAPVIQLYSSAVCPCLLSIYKFTFILNLNKIRVECSNIRNLNLCTFTQRYFHKWSKSLVENFYHLILVEWSKYLSSYNWIIVNFAEF